MKVITNKKGEELAFLTVVLPVATLAALIIFVYENETAALAWIGCQLLVSLTILFESKETKKKIYDELENGESLNWFTSTMFFFLAAPGIVVLYFKFLIIPSIKKRILNKKGEEELKEFDCIDSQDK